jgi:large subunit ribosomal protein L20
MRVKAGVVTRRKHKKILKMAEGYRGAASKRYKVANEALLHAMKYAFIGRKLKKREYRSLWITRINALARQHDISYSRLMNGLKIANIDIDRKMLADLAINDEKAFLELVGKAKTALSKQAA